MRGTGITRSVATTSRDLPSSGRGPDAGMSESPNGETGRRPSRGHAQVAEIQRARMLTAMVQEVSGRGAANVSVGHVVGRSGVSRRTFYEIFEDREDCFLAAFDDALNHAAASVIPAYERPGSWREKIRAGLTALLESLESDRAMGRLLIVESLAAGPGALKRRQSALDQIISIVEQGSIQAKAALDPPALTAEGVVGGVLSVLHARLIEQERRTGDRHQASGGSLLDLAGPLMGMIVLPYLGQAAARKEIERPAPKSRGKSQIVRTDPLQDLPMRFTYRTMRVLVSVAEQPGSSNRAIGAHAGIGDQGQASKLLARLHKLGLIENQDGDPARGEPNAWTLTTIGQQVHESIAGLGS
jgi:AcrR family transcriptional regulator/DNA-binding MarR family transcriptional regulator